MHNKPHTEKAKAKMRATKLKQPKKWGWLPEKEIVSRLLHTEATTSSIASEYGCSASTINIIFRKHTNKDERLKAKNRKAAEKKRGRPNPIFSQWRNENDVWTGRKHSRETKQKQSEAKKGKRHSVKRRIKQSARLQNISLNNWKGFASSKTERLKASQKYKDWRKSVFERDNWTCQKCDKRGGNLHAHHIEPKSKNPKKILDLQNGITLCADCHRETDTYGVNNRKS